MLNSQNAVVKFCRLVWGYSLTDETHEMSPESHEVSIRVACARVKVECRVLLLSRLDHAAITVQSMEWRPSGLSWVLCSFAAERLPSQYVFRLGRYPKTSSGLWGNARKVSWFSKPIVIPSRLVKGTGCNNLRIQGPRYGTPWWSQMCASLKTGYTSVPAVWERWEQLQQKVQIRDPLI